MKQIDCDVAIIGAGPAGLAAAKSAYASGAKDVILIERDKYLGGILQQCIHNGFGIHLLGEDKTGPEYAEYFIRQVEELNIKCLTEAMAIGLSDTLEIQAVNTQGICKRGQEYAKQEIYNPARYLTTTVKLKGGNQAMLPVRTFAPIPKEKLIPAMHQIAKLEVCAPVNIGQVICDNITDTGVPLIASKSICTKNMTNL